MIVCDIQMFENTSDVQIAGNPDTIYAEVCEIIKAALQTMTDDEKEDFKNRLSNKAAWRVIDLTVKYRERCKNK